jgi:hypothetical protein
MRVIDVYLNGFLFAPGARVPASTLICSQTP